MDTQTMSDKEIKEFTGITIYRIETSPQEIYEDGKIEIRFDDWLESKGVKRIKGCYGNSDLWVEYVYDIVGLESENWFKIKEISIEEYFLNLNRYRAKREKINTIITI